MQLKQLSRKIGVCKVRFCISQQGGMERVSCTLESIFMSPAKFN